MKGKPLRLGVSLSILVLALAAGLAAGLYTYRQYQQMAVDEAISRLTLFHGLRKATLEDYMRSKASDVRAMSRNRRVIDAFVQFSEGWQEIGLEPSKTLRRLYIDDNPFRSGQKSLLRKAGDGSAYSQAHAEFHDWARRFLDHFGYKDLYLIDRDGNILYSVEKHEDFATNLDSGPFEATALGYVFHQARRQEGNKVTLSDLEPYDPGNGVPAAFAGSAILNKDGELAGVFAVRFTGEQIDDILRYVAGMGLTGQTYIVGNDLLMRSQSRFDTKATTLVTEVDTEPARDGLNGFSGTQIAEDYRGMRVLSVYSVLDFGGPPWVLLAEMEEAEVLDQVPAWPALLAALLAATLAAAVANLVYRLKSGS